MRDDGRLGAAVRAMMVAAVAFGAAACGGDRRQSEGGEVEGGPAGGFANGGNAFDSTPAPGTAGSGTAVAGGAAGNTAVAPGSGAMTSGDPSDAAIASVIQTINTSEVESGQLAAQKARDPEVRRYASDMVAAHQAGASSGAAAAAGATGEGAAGDFLTWHRDVHRKTMQALQTMPAGPRFDLAYLESQVEAHQGALRTLDKLEEAAAAPAVTERLRAMEANVRQHLQRARALQQRVGRGVSQ